MDINILHKTLIVSGIAPSDTIPEWQSFGHFYDGYAHTRGYPLGQPAFVGSLPPELQMAYNEVEANPEQTEVALQVFAEPTVEEPTADAISNDEKPADAETDSQITEAVVEEQPAKPVPEVEKVVEPVKPVVAAKAAKPTQNKPSGQKAVTNKNDSWD